MKIIFLAKRFSPDIGGVEKHALAVAKVLVDEGHDVTVITESQGLNRVDRVPVIRIPVFPEGKMKKFLIWKWVLSHFQLFLSANVIHVHDVFFWILPIRILCAWKPIFVTFHGYETVVPPTRKSIILRHIYEFLAWGNICVGKFLTKWYGTSPTYVTYGGCEFPRSNDPQLSFRGSKATEKSQKKKLQITFVGRLEEDNDLPIYLEALKLLREKKISFEFTAVGDGSLHKEVKAYGKVTGFIPDVSKFVQYTEILFASSYLSILDGFSAEKLVIATYSNPLKKDYLEMTPFAKDMIISSDPDEIAQTIINYNISPKKFASIRENSHQFAKENTWENVTQTYHRLWKK